MATELKLRRGTTAQHASFTGAAGEVTVDTDKDTVVVHDGSTAGGFPLARETNPTINGNVTTTGLNFDSNTFVIDATNNRVGIGTASPTYKLDIAATSGGVQGDVKTSRVSTGTYPVGISMLDSGGTRGARIEGSLNAINYKSGSDGSTSYSGTYGHVFYNGSSEVARIDSSGNVGIGTSAPTGTLTVYKDVNSTTVPTAQSDYSIVVKVNGDVTGDYVGGIAFGDNAVSTAQAAILAVDSGGSATTSLAFATGSTAGIAERMRIDSSGNVGIGTSSPERPFHVFSSGIVQAFIETSGSSARLAFESSGSNTNAGNLIAVDANDMWFRTNNTERMRIDSSGNVGIGTSSPAQTLHTVGNTRSDGVIMTNGGSAAAPSHTFTGDLNTGIFGTGGDVIGFSTAGTERMRITSSGNVGVGTSSPNAKFVTQITSSTAYANTAPSIAGCVLSLTNTANHVSGGVFAITQYSLTGDSQNRIGYIGAISGSASDQSLSLVFGTNSAGGDRSERMRIDSSGNLLVGTTSADAKIHVQNSTNSIGAYFDSAAHNTSGDGGVRTRIGGNCNNTSSNHFRGTTDGVNNWYLYGNGTTSYSSDERLKKNIETTRDGYLNDLMALRVVKYNWYTDEDSTPKELGLIAQEVEEVFPGLVQEHDLEGVGMRKNIKHSVMEFILIKAIQELKVENDALKSRLDAAGL